MDVKFPAIARFRCRSANAIVAETHSLGCRVVPPWGRVPEGRKVQNSLSCAKVVNSHYDTELEHMTLNSKPHGSETIKPKASKKIYASLSALNFGVQTTNWASCGVLYPSCREKVILTCLSIGASINPSKRSLAPSNPNEVRTSRA